MAIGKPRISRPTDPIDSGGTPNPTPGPTGRFADGYRLWLPGDQGTGNVLDLSGKGADAVPAGSLAPAEMWAVPDQITLPGGAGKFALIDGSKTSVDISTDSIILSFWINKAAPAAAEWWGKAWPDPVFFQFAPDGSMSVFGREVGGNSQKYGAVPGIANGQPHHIVVAIDAIQKQVWIYADKILRVTTGLTLTKSTANTKAWPLGLMLAQNGAPPDVNSVAIAMRLWDIHLVTPVKLVSPSLPTLVRKLYHSSRQPLNNGDLS